MLRILSANLWNGRADPQAFAELVATLEADVVATQELSPEQADALAQVLPHGELEPARNHVGMGIALSAPAKVTRIDLGHRTMPIARLEPEAWPALSRPVEVVNLHVYAPHVFRPRVGLLHRRTQMADFERYLSSADATPRAVVGDFNASPVWPVYRRISSHLTDAAIAVAQQRGRPLANTWGPWPRAPRLFRIDHGFVRGLQPSEFRVVPIASSDHSAIVMDVALA